MRLAVAGVLMAAAAIALWFALPSGILGLQDDPGRPAAAADRSQPTAPQQTIVTPPPDPTPPPRAVVVQPEAATPDELHVPAVEPSGTGTGGEEADERPARPRHTLAELDALARDAWRAGELKRARRLFERVVARGGRGERADIAYGDLFTLARRQGDASGLRRYWKRYIKRFPKGRYIDDARAGLCRAKKGDAQRTCWRAYLKARPRGTYRADAEAALRTP